MSRKILIYGYMNKGYCGQSALVECDIRSGFPGFDIIGLPGTIIKEARERVRCALRSSGFRFPQNRILINLSPASQPKDSTMLDLSLALSILVRLNKTSDDSDLHFDQEVIKVMAAGELTLEGQILETPQALGAIEAAKNCGCQVCLLPFCTTTETEGIKVIDVRTLPQALQACLEIQRDGLGVMQNKASIHEPPIFSDVIGLEQEKEILAMAAAGFHSILLFGPPGVGKSMLSSRIHRLLPDLDARQKDELSRILGCADQTTAMTTVHNGMRTRAISHDCTQTQFISGPASKQPGEGAKAHYGTLVLDEINCYTPKLLQTIRDAYDKGFTSSSRSGEVISYPASFLMVGNMNPCSCGGLGSHDSTCSCTAQKLENHWKHVGRQMIERFDIRLPIQCQTDMLSKALEPQKPDSYFREKVALSADRQKMRYKYIDKVDYNGQVHLSTSALLLLKKEVSLFNRINCQNDLSSRTQIGCISLARSLADYEDCEDVTEEHFLKAMELRRYGLGDYYWRSLL